MSRRATTSLAWLRVEVGVGVVEAAVVDADVVVDDAASDVAPQREADVAIGGQILGQRALDDRQVGVGLQALEAERRLELAGAQAQVRRRMDVGVAVEDHRRAAREVGDETEVRDTEQRAVDRRPEPAQQERVQTIREGRVTEKPARVGLQQSMDAQLIGGIGAANAESALVGDHAGALLGLGRELLLEELELAPGDTRGLIRLVHFRGQGREGGRVDGGWGRRRRLGRRRRYLGGRRWHRGAGRRRRRAGGSGRVGWNGSGGRLRSHPAGACEDGEREHRQYMNPMEFVG